MELVDQFHALENEIKLVKGEIKKVLVDLREAMNTAGNSSAYIEQIQLDEERVKNLEKAVEQLKGLEGGSGIEEERLRKVEDAIEEERLRKVEDAIEELKRTVTGLIEEKVKNLKGTMQELKQPGGIEVDRPNNIEPDIKMLTEPEKPSGSMLVRRPELGNEVVDTITLAQLIQWADTTANLIGREKLNQVVELLELTGRISKETKDTIFKIAKLPDLVQTQEKEHVEARHCIIALFELNRILTGRHQELSTLLKDSMLRNNNAK